MSTVNYGAELTEEESQAFRAKRLKEEIPKQIDDWLLRQAEGSAQRYLEAEQFLMDLDNLPWYKGWMWRIKTREFLRTRLKYNF